MSAPASTPADRLRLRRRIEIARRAVDLLRNKEEALDREHVRLRSHASRAVERWREDLDTATTALVRAQMLGGSDEVTRLVAAGRSDATVTIEWVRSMGIEFPGDVTGEPGERPLLTSTAALIPTAEAFAVALRSAADAAAATEAVRRLEVELSATRRRRRSVDEHHLPELEATEHRLELRLDELDREEALRTRIAVERKETR